MSSVGYNNGSIYANQTMLYTTLIELRISIDTAKTLD